MTQDAQQLDTAAGTSAKVCYLHIGPHKTGTTSIQHALYSNGDRLATIGLSYPTLWADRGHGRRRNHTPLARHSSYRVDDLKDSPYWADLHDKIANLDGSIIVSTEHFADALRDEERYAKTVGFFHERGYKVVAVAFVRDQPGWLNSWYTQNQRNFVSRQTFSEFLDSALEIGLVDPWAYLGRFIADERVDVRVASFEQAVKQGLTKSFLRLCGAPEDFEIPEPKASNPNLGIKGLYAAQEIMRRTNTRIRALPNYAELYESFKHMMRGRDWEQSAYVGVSPEDERRIRDRYRESNDAFARQWFGTDWETICPPRSMTLREFDVDAATDEEKRDVFEVVDGMVDLIRQSTGETPPKPAKSAPAGDKGGAGKGKRSGKGFGKGAGKGDGRRPEGAPQKAGGKGPDGKKGAGKKPRKAPTPVVI